MAKQAETIGVEILKVFSPIQLDTLLRQGFVANIIASELGLLELARNQRICAINLYRVLGGGW
jgi:hypothetical protein